MARAIALGSNLVMEGAALPYLWWYLGMGNCEVGIVHPYQSRRKITHKFKILGSYSLGSVCKPVEGRSIRAQNKTLGFTDKLPPECFAPTPNFGLCRHALVITHDALVNDLRTSD
jgi:hypothetical protein